MKRYSIFYNKLFLYFLSLALIIFVSGIISYSSIYAKSRKSFDNQIQSNIDSVSMQHENSARGLFDMRSQFFNNIIVKKHMKPKWLQEQEDRLYLRDICSSLQTLRFTSEDFISEIFAYSDADMIYTPMGTYSSDYYLSECYVYEKYDLNFWSSILSENENIRILKPSYLINHQYNTSEHVIPFVESIYNNGNISVIVINVSVEELLNKYRDNALFDSTRFVVLDGGGNTIISDLPEEELEIIVSDDKSTVSAQYKKGYIINYSKLNLYNLQIYSFTPLREIYNIEKHYLSYIIMLYLALTLVGIAFSILYSNRIYKPIQHISSKLFPEHDKIKPKHINEIDYIQSQIQNLLEQKNIYVIKRREYNYFLVRQCLYNMIANNEIYDLKYFKHILFNDIGFNTKYYQCCVFIFNGEEYKNYDVMENLGSVIEEKLARHFPVIAFQYRQNALVLVINLNSLEENQLHAIISVLFSRYLESEHIRIGIGGIVSDIQKIKESFEAACNELFMRIYFNKVDIAVNTKLQRVLTLDEEALLLSSIKKQNIKKLMSVVSKIIQSAFNQGISFTNAISMVKSIFEPGTMLVNKLDIDSQLKEDILSAADPVGVLLLKTEPDMEAIKKFYQGIIQVMPLCTTSEQNAISIEVKKYIDQNYEKNLSLTSIAEAFCMSPKYISRIFKEDMQMNLSDYLSFVRIQKSKELLCCGKYSVQDVAEKVGIFSHTTFIRTFRRIEGMLPSEYRDMLKTERINKEDGEKRAEDGRHAKFV